MYFSVLATLALGTSAWAQQQQGGAGGASSAASGASSAMTGGASSAMTGSASSAMSGSASAAPSGGGSNTTSPAAGGNSTATGSPYLQAALGMLSQQCRQSVQQIMAPESETGKCLHTGIVLAAANSNSSLVPYLGRYLDIACADDPCTNATMTQVAQTVSQSCQEDLQKINIAPEQVKQIVSYYPLAREALCFKDTKSAGSSPAAGNSTTGGSNSTAGAGSSQSMSQSESQTQSQSQSQPSGQSTQSAQAKRQEQQSQSESQSQSQSQSQAQSATGSSAAMPSQSGGAAAGGSSNSSSPAAGGNSTTKGEYCAVPFLREVEKAIGGNLTFGTVFQLISGDQQLLKKLDEADVTEKLCTECGYGVVSLIHESAPEITAMIVDKEGNKTFDAWFTEKCPAANSSISSNGTLPDGIEATAQNSTIGVPIIFKNSTSGETTTKSAPTGSATPIAPAAGANSTQSSNSTSSQTGGAAGGSSSTQTLSQSAQTGSQSAQATGSEQSAQATGSEQSGAQQSASQGGEQQPQQQQRRKLRFEH